MYFLDTSALTKLYVREAGTDRMLDLANDPDAQVAVLALTGVEFRSAVRRRQAAGDIDAQSAESVLNAFQEHLSTRYLLQPVTDAVLQASLRLVDRFGVRAYDAVQLAGCVSLRDHLRGEPMTFVCSDRLLCRAAVAEELAVLDPETEE